VPIDLDRRRVLLTAALGFALLDTKDKPAPKEIQLVRGWLDNWTGLGHVATGMQRQGFKLHLTNVEGETWRARSRGAPISARKDSARRRRRGARCRSPRGRRGCRPAGPRGDAARPTLSNVTALVGGCVPHGRRHRRTVSCSSQTGIRGPAGYRRPTWSRRGRQGGAAPAGL
jgi:hypothetical protein